MRPATSLFLDVLRVFAALVVFAHHCSLVLYANRVWIPGHDAVVIFFVLSGYVITGSTLTRRNPAVKQYVIARLTRLYSVVLPALALTVALALAGSMINPHAYALIIRDHDWLRVVATAFFLQAIWWWNLPPPGNGPFWSLGYEFWYYVLFGLWVFVRDWRWKIGLVLACGLFVGLNVLLLLPIWLLGAAIYLYGHRMSLARGSAAVIFVLALLVTGVLPWYLPEFPAAVGFAPLFYSGSFLTDWLLGLGVGIAIWSFDQAWGTVAVTSAWEPGIRWGANHTFSLYLFHMPLLVFFNALGVFQPQLWWSAVLEIGLVLLVIVVLAELTESRRKSLQRLVTRFWDGMGRLRKQPAPVTTE